jgi:hypothetical protein
LARRSEKTWKELTELVAAFEVYVANLNVCEHQHLRASAPLLEQGLGPHRRAVAGGIDGPPWPKGLLIGLRQGARETFPQMAGTFRTHPEVVKEIRKAGGESLTQLTKMIKRGRIRNVDEYYAVRARIDEIEGCGNNDAELRGLYELLERFELRARQASK